MDTLLDFRRIIFWEPCVSPHKSDFIQVIARLLPTVELICCADSDLPANRKALGWLSPNSTNAGIKTLIAPSAEQIQQLVYHAHQNTFHVFSGTRHCLTLIDGLRAVKTSKARFAILSEPRVREGWKGQLRFLQSWLTEGWLRQNCAFVLAIGRNGPPWFQSVGYAAQKIFPFAYFVEPPQRPDALPRHADEPSQSSIQVGYVGRLVRMKGIFDLVQAMSLLDRKARLTLVGGGPDEEALRAMCAQNRVDAVFRGVLPMPSIGEAMARLDVLVLASTSKDDGWGVVVSEALMSGTAVIATPCVGASLVLDDPRFGVVVSPHDPVAIATAIRTLQDAGAFALPNRLARQALARSRLSAEAGARYFVAILQHRLGGAACPRPFHHALPVEDIQPSEPLPALDWVP